MASLAVALKFDPSDFSPVFWYRIMRRVEQQEVADALEVDRLSVYRYERWLRVPDDDVLPRIARLVGWPPAALRAEFEARRRR